MAAASASDRHSLDRAVPRAVIALAVGAIIAFGVVVIGSTFLGKQIARDEELAEAVRSGDLLVRTVLAGSIEALVSGDPQGATQLNDAVEVRRRNGSTVYLRVVGADGEVIYPLESPAIDSRLQTTPNSLAETGAALISIREARSEIEAFAVGRTVRVGVPMSLPGGGSVSVFVYSTDDRLRTSEAALSVKLVRLSVGSVSLLLLLNLPVSIWLLRRVGKAHLESVKLLSHDVAAADRERRNIARDLHDGVIQDLAGAGYALEALLDEFRPHADEYALRMLDLSHDAVQRSTQALRTLIIEVAPPDLTSENLTAEIEVLAQRLRKDHRVDVDVAINLDRPVDRQVATVVYRAVRECLINVVKHAGAKHAWISIRSDPSNVYVVAEDDGNGFPRDMAARRRNGHVGLSLLAGTVADLGGQLTIDDHRDDGAAVRFRIPIG